MNNQGKIGIVYTYKKLTYSNLYENYFKNFY